MLLGHTRCKHHPVLPYQPIILSSFKNLRQQRRERNVLTQPPGICTSTLQNWAGVRGATMPARTMYPINEVRETLHNDKTLGGFD